MEQISSSGQIAGAWWDSQGLAELIRILSNSNIGQSLIVAQFILPSKEWDIAKLQGPDNQSCIQAMLATLIPLNSIPNSICWNLTGSGEFTTESATWATHGLDLRKSQSWDFRCIWKLDINA